MLETIPKKGGGDFLWLPQQGAYGKEGAGGPAGFTQSS